MTRIAANETRTTTTTTTERKTLRELGIPGALATELEAAFRYLGATVDDRVMGFTFVAPDGSRHALRAEGVTAAATLDRAA